MNNTFGILILLICLLSTKAGSVQSPTQVIRGTVIDKQSLVTLPGANVVILDSNPAKGASSGVDGSFKITGVNPGRYDLQATYLGYKSVVISSVVVTVGKEVVLEIGLEENISSLKEVVISGAKKQGTINQMAPVSARSFSMEEVNRYAGGRSGPLRLVANYGFILIKLTGDSASGSSPAAVPGSVSG